MGNVDATPARLAFAVDTAAPATTVTGGPGDLTADRRPTFTFVSGDAAARFACSVDGGPFGPCSGPGRHQPAAALAEGAHTFAVRATDSAGNTGAAVARAFRIDTVPSVTQLRLSRSTVKRSARKAKRRVTARFALDQPAVVTLGVRRKGRRVARRTAELAAGEHALRFTLKARARTGRHTVALVARDAAGNASAPLEARLRVRR
jgi:hypothetical protein